LEFALVGPAFSGKSSVMDLLARGGDLPPSTALRKLTVKMRDPRLEALSAALEPKKTTPVTATVVDPPAGASATSAEGSADRFAHARTADGLIAVLRAFTASEVPNPAGAVDPVRDMRALLSDLVLADFVVVEGRLERIARMRKVGKKPESPLEEPLLEKCRAALEDDNPLASLELQNGELRLLSGFGLLTLKPLLAVLNVGEAAPGDGGATRRAVLANFGDAFPDIRALAVCAPLETELAAMEEAEAREFMESEGIEVLGCDSIAQALGPTSGRITFFTVIRDEIRAWAVPAGTTALRAAGAIHSDMEKGFVKAEAIGWKELVECGSTSAAREKGLLRLEGREYVVRDGDVLTVRFSPGR